MLKNIKIGMRMGLSFGLILLFIIGLILIGLNAMKVINKEMEAIVKVENIRAKLAHYMIDNARETAIAVRSILVYKFNNQPEEQITKTLEEMATTRASYLDKVAQLNAMIPKDLVGLAGKFEKVRGARVTAWKFQDEVIQKVKAGKTNEGADLMANKAYPAVKVWIANLDDLIKMEDGIRNQRFADSQQLYSNVRTTLLIMGGISFVLALIISIMLTLSIVRPIRESMTAASSIASNDLTINISDTERKDEIGFLFKAFHQMLENLRQSVKDINEGVNMLGSSASEILAATTQVAAGTAQTSSAISETTTTVEEIQQATKQSAQKAKNVADSAMRVLQVSQKGQKAVEETVKSMNHISEQMDSIAQTVVRLSEQSQSIGGIIASVTEIADQSNLLAVNAAIEAAKAGEHGKGFAVVAQEIKNLAGQSKQATMQVRNILNDIQKATGAAVMATEQGSKAVDSGVKQSMQAGETISVLAESINEALQATTQIVASSQQQVIGMDQIGMAMQNINQAGTETAVSMVQTEKAARNLHDLGQKLKDMVDKFKL